MRSCLASAVGLGLACDREPSAPASARTEAQEPQGAQGVGDAKAEETKAGSAKAERPEVDDAKAKDAKAEDTKAEDTKAEEAKAEEAKAEDVKAEDAKAEDAKAEDAKAEAGERPEAPPSVEPVAAGAVSALPWSGDQTRSADELLSEKMGRRIRSNLRKQHDAMTQITAKIVLPEADGGVTVLALYEYSQFEVCVAKAGGGKEARRQCADEAVDSNERPMAALRRCTGRGLVRARFGPPLAKNPAYGGPLEILATRPVGGGCTVDTVRHFRLRDVDGDSRPELEVELLSVTPDTTFRDGSRFEVKSRSIGWYRDDLTPQFERVLASWGYDGEALEEIEHIRFALRDADGDGGVDLVLESVTLHPMDCSLDGDGWPADFGECEEAEPSDVVQTVWAYDRAKDTWAEPSSSAG